MKSIRIRSIQANHFSPWIYIQENQKENFLPAPLIESQTFTIQAAASKTNQFGKFRYHEKQYGILHTESGSSIEMNSLPIRIRSVNGDFVYLQQIILEGLHSTIRIRSRYQHENSPWVYLEQREV